MVGSRALTFASNSGRSCVSYRAVLVSGSRSAILIFVAVLHRVTPEMVLEMKARLQSAVDNFAYEVRPGRVARVGISIGHATYAQDGTAIDELMAAPPRMRSRPFSIGPLNRLERIGVG